MTSFLAFTVIIVVDNAVDGCVTLCCLCSALPSSTSRSSSTSIDPLSPPSLFLTLSHSHGYGCYHPYYPCMLVLSCLAPALIHPRLPSSHLNFNFSSSLSKSYTYTSFIPPLLFPRFPLFLVSSLSPIPRFLTSPVSLFLVSSPLIDRRIVLMHRLVIAISPQIVLIIHPY
ncbi:hypothetical protein EV368DRAFT_84438 [Lentinula lateritia]|nr:hypothetical protein EV368DRAFT_84438 [Lentinula lateritia]